jgi:hypothetical protein
MALVSMVAVACVISCMFCCKLGYHGDISAGDGELPRCLLN